MVDIHGGNFSKAVLQSTKNTSCIRHGQLLQELDRINSSSWFFEFFDNCKKIVEIRFGLFYLIQLMPSDFFSTFFDHHKIPLMAKSLTF